MGRPNRYENDSYAGFMRRAVRAFGRRAGEDIDALAMLVQLRAELDATIAEAARAAHDGEHAYSWTEIANDLGITRQAARQRFAATPGERRDAERQLEVLRAAGQVTA